MEPELCDRVLSNLRASKLQLQVQGRTLREKLAPSCLDFDSVSALLSYCSMPEAPGMHVRLTNVTVLQRRKRSKDRLYFLMVSDETSADTRLEVKLSAYSGALSPTEAAAAIRSTTIGTVANVLEGVIEKQPWEGGGYTLSATRVEMSAANETPAILFDLNYLSMMTDDEHGAICRQLRLSYTSNRRSSRPFNIYLGGAGITASGAQNISTEQAKLGVAAAHGHWAQWENVQLIDSASPWECCKNVTYLCADSPNVLGTIDTGSTLVIGGLADHTPKPGASARRAEKHGVRTARLPLEQFLKLRSRVDGDGTGGADVTTLAVVQILLGWREFGSWEGSIPACPALRCAPMRKYVRWLPPYEALNDASRPTELFPSSDAVSVTTSAQAPGAPGGSLLVESVEVANLNSDVGQIYAAEEATGEYLRIGRHAVCQENSTFCGLCSLAMVLNSFANSGIQQHENSLQQHENSLHENDIFTRCVADPNVSALAKKADKCGLVLEELAMLAEALGLKAEVMFADETTEISFFGRMRAALLDPSRRVLLNYHMTTMGQPSGNGHISPVGGWHEASGSYLVLDCWYETDPCWAVAANVWEAVCSVDQEAQRSRGCLLLAQQ
jgi:hypothetical protein